MDDARCSGALLVLEALLGTLWGHTTQKPIYRTVVTLGTAVSNARENPWSIVLG